MNTSIQHPPYLSGTPQEGNLNVSQVSDDVTQAKETVEKIMKRVGGFIAEVKEKRNEFIAEEKKKKELEIENQRKIEEIVIACEWSKNEIIQIFGKGVRETGNLNDSVLWNPGLMWLIQYNEMEILKLIITHSDISLNENHGRETALMAAVYHGHTEIIQLLLADPRLDLQAYDQWKKSLEETKDPEIQFLIEEAMTK